MKANEFVKNNGLDKAKIHLEKMKSERWVNSFFNDLKSPVEAHDLVGSFGGLDLAKECLGQLPNKHQSYTLTRDDTGKTTQSFKLQQAITDVESTL